MTNRQMTSSSPTNRPYPPRTMMDESTDVAIRPGLQAGSRFGHDQLGRLLGEGGFGRVWEPQQTLVEWWTRSGWWAGPLAAIGLAFTLMVAAGFIVHLLQ